MTSGNSGDIARIGPGQLRDGDLVIRQADIERHPDLDTDSLLAKLGQLGLPPSVLARPKIDKKTVELATYDPETQPLGKAPWSELETFMEESQLEPGLRTRIKSSLAHLHVYGTGRDGNPRRGYLDQERLPVLYSKASGDVSRAMYLWSNDDMEDVLIDVDAVYDYLSHGVTRFDNMGVTMEATLAGFVNGRIAALPEA